MAHTLSAHQELLNKLDQHFENAAICMSIDQMAVSPEIETIFQDRRENPVNRRQSQEILRRMVQKKGWINGTANHNGFVTSIKKDGSELMYDAGWNILELTVPPKLMHELPILENTLRSDLDELYAVAGTCGAFPVQSHFIDTCRPELAMLEDDRNCLLARTDGTVRHLMTGIASVHWNIDVLGSLNTGFEWLRNFRTFCEDNGFPKQESSRSWTKYITGAGYEPNRIGFPPEFYGDYLEGLSQLQVRVNRNRYGRLVSLRPGCAAWKVDDLDIELHLKSVWWNARLRVRNGRLVLEFRSIPRTADHEIVPFLKRMIDKVCQEQPPVHTAIVGTNSQSS